MAAKSLRQWCHSVLPDNFKQVNEATAKIQQFLIENLPEPINQQVRVMNITQDEIVVAAADPQIANYLRLYATEIKQQLHETLNLKRKLKFRSMPDSIFQIEPPRISNKITPVLQETAATIDRSANSIEDEKLKRAVQSLAHTLKQK